MMYRLDRDITQKDMADLLGATQKQICEWENGVRKPTKLREKQIMDFLSQRPRNET